MDNRIEHVLNELKTSLGLKKFVLHTYSLSQEVSAFGGFDILLSADWLPPAVEIPEEDDLLPDGTVSVRYSLRYQQLLLATTQGERSFAEALATSEEQFIQWTEQQTGLDFEDDFILTNRSETAIEGAVIHNGIPVQTDGFLELEWDESGRLLFCTLPLVVTKQFEEVPFSLTLEAIESLVREQLTPIRLPIEDEARFADYFAIDEVFITQDRTVLPYFTEEQSAEFSSNVLQWQTSSKYEVNQQTIHPLLRELSPDEAYSVLAHPENRITDETVQRCVQSATAFLSAKLPEESGEWEVYRILQQPNSIEVVCRKIDETAGPLRRKLVLMLHKDTYELLNFLDSIEMAQLFEGFTQALVQTISQEEAFELMVDYITLDPRYVYHQSSGIYKLCGLLDAEECVDAVTGELKQLNDL